MKHTSAFASILSGLLVALAACGSSGGTAVTDKPLNELTDEEFVEACETIRDEVSADAITGGGRYFCAVFTCEQGDAAFEDCLDEPTTGDDCEAPAEDAPERDCDLPASTLAACSIAYSDQFAAYADVTCADVATLDEPTPIEELPACAEVVERCPDVLD